MKQTRMMALGMLLAVVTPCLAFAGNLSDVIQVGNNVLATTDQVGADNTATVNQYGDYLKADVDQLGDTNTATVDQGNAGTPANSSQLVGYVSGAVIYQEGDRNMASTTWHVGNQGSRITQTGDDNSGTQDLSAHEGYSAGKFAIDIQQVGNNNLGTQVTTYKYGTYGIQDMLLQQTGNNNSGTQTSLSGKSIGMEIIQTGNDNISTQLQDGMQDVASAKMVGSFNTTEQVQAYTVWGLTNRSAVIDIVGSNNFASQTQLGIATVADITMVGDRNSAVQNQVGDNNFAKLTQVGNDNIATQTQSGAWNSSTVSQTGNFNNVAVTQSN
ncbi:hypothetical protein [Geomonas anaerohicana]|uniref:Curlin associated repeat-containing protein n=1 Tax=Geomonas anaerohicana TaxID=2798583 RepID=A0ABS0YDA7_9BACT|nr:hypothetical protein [Geomonas anaerohicana]MBJ6749912.1 hypothetical protein [Geomonas anaerohicana]